MRKATFAIASIAIAAAFTFVTVTDADAQRRRGNRGAGVAAGIAAGIAAGALIAGSRPAYSEPRRVYRSSCWQERRRWSNRRQAWIVTRYRVC